MELPVSRGGSLACAGPVQETPAGPMPTLLRGAIAAVLAVCAVRLWLHAGLAAGTVCRAISPVTWEETVLSPQTGALPALETGDVLVTLSVHTLGWRHGHCALVADGEERLVLEAATIHVPSCIQPAEVWERYDTIWLLRPKALTEGERAALAAYAQELNGLPYSLFSRKVEAPCNAQCATLVWYAYRHLGYDIDGNGGWLVVPADLLKCGLFEVKRLR